MATYFARKSGNVNAVDVWATTPTGTASDVFSTFTSSDILVANSFSITVNVNLTVAELRIDNTGGATTNNATGFTLSDGIILTANIYGATTTTNASCCAITGAASVTIVGNIVGGTANVASIALNISSGRPVYITGSVNGGTGLLCHAIGHGGTGSLFITGNVTAGVGNSSYSSNGINYSSTGPLTITGNVIGNANISYGIVHSGPGLLTITGNCTGGTSSSSSSALVMNSASSVCSVAGTATGSVGPAISVSAGTCNIIRSKGGPLVGSSVGVVGGFNAVTNVDEIEYGDLGASPTSGRIIFSNKTSNVAVMYRFGTTKKTLLDSAASNLLPSASDVRSGIVYNAGQTTGTCSVPPANSVAAGFPVDNTVGTANLTAIDFWDYLSSNINTSGSIGERLTNCATISSVSTQLAGVL